MPRMDKLVDAIGGRNGKYFKTLDLMKGYHQVKMEKQLKPKTAFICHSILSYAFWPQQWHSWGQCASCSVARNGHDILVVSATFEDHLRDVGLDLWMQDCVSNPVSVHLPGRRLCTSFTVSSEGGMPNQEKVKTIVDYHQILGYVEFTHTAVARPLMVLTCKDQNFLSCESNNSVCYHGYCLSTRHHYS